MTFRADGTSVIEATEQGDHGVALAFDAASAQKIAAALNEQPGARGVVTDPLTGQEVDKLDIHDQRPISELLGDNQHIAVVGPYVTVEMGTPEGRQIRSLLEGAVLPADVTAGKARHLLDTGLAKIVEAPTPAEAAEGMPTERHRLEAAAVTGLGPTVGHPQPGTLAARYEEDPEAAARELAAAAPSPAATPAGPLPGVRPADDAAKPAWVEYAVSRGADADAAKAATKADLVREYGGG